MDNIWCFNIGGTGVKLTIPGCNRKLSNEEKAGVDKAGILKMTCLDSIYEPEDVEIITPEEYEEQFGDDEDE